MRKLHIRKGRRILEIEGVAKGSPCLRCPFSPARSCTCKIATSEDDSKSSSAFFFSPLFLSLFPPLLLFFFNFFFWFLLAYGLARCKRRGLQFAAVLGANTWQQYLVTSRLQPRYNDHSRRRRFLSATPTDLPRTGGCNFSLADTCVRRNRGKHTCSRSRSFRSPFFFSFRR